MFTRYLTIKYTKPIPVKFKGDIDLFQVLNTYIDVYGDCFIGLFNNYDEAIEAQKHWYILFGDEDICKDLNTIDHLEKCLQV